MDTDHYQIDTKGMCFLCLRECKHTTENPDRDKAPYTSFRIMMRYLKINVLHLGNLPSSSSLLNSMEGMDNTEVEVILCDSCSTVVNQFSELYQQLEGIRLKMDNCVEVVRDLIDEAERNTEVKEEFAKRLRRAKNAFELFIASLAENLRKETKNKCDLKLKESIPRVTLQNQKVESSQSSPVTQISSPQKVTPPQSPPLQPVRTYAAVASEKMVATKSTSNNMPSSRTQVDSIEVKNEEAVVDPAPKVEIVSLSDDESDNSLEDAPSSSTPIASAPPMLHHNMTSIRKPVHAPRTSASPNKISNRSCHICGKCFKTPQQLRRHIPVHSGLRPHKCEYCGRAFTQGCNLRTHTMSVHTMEVVKQSLPPRCTEDHLNKAIKLILDRTSMFPEDRKTPCGCPHCERRFRSKFELRTHILQCHFEVVLSRIRNLGNLSKRKSDLGSRKETFSSAPVIMASTSYSNFDMEDVMQLDEPVVEFVNQYEDIQILDPLYLNGG